MKIPLAITLLVLLAGSAHAEPLSRATVVARAAKKNPQSTAARAGIEGARALKAEANAARWPMISLRAGIGPSMRAKLEPGTALTSTEGSFEELGLNDLSAVFGARLEIIQPLYTFGKIDLRRSAADLNIRAEKARADMTAAELAFTSASLYESYLYARDAVRFFEEIEHTLNRSILATKSRLEDEQADVSEQDLLRLQQAHTLARLGLNQATTGVAQASAGLRAYLALDPGTEITVADDRLEPIAAHEDTIDELVGVALQHRPELAALSAGAAAYDKLADAERAGYYPDFFIMGTIDGAYTPGRDFVRSRYVIDPLGHFVPTLILGLNWTLHGSSSGARARQKRAEARRFDALRDWAESAMPAEVRVAALDAKRALADVGETTAAVKRAKKWLVQASADYSAGLSDSKSFTDSVESYATMRVAHLDAVRRFNIAMAALAKATGTIVTDGSAVYPGKASP